MKAFTLLLTLTGSALALPRALEPRQSSAVQVTDTLLFGISLPAFTARRNARDPPTLDWTTDGCTSSPDNPFGFNFVPACHRHDFGYHNYRAQGRFTQSGKLRIDDNFHADLDYQCQFEGLPSVCRGLADVYYAAVRAFGGGDASPGKRAETHEELVRIYEEKVAIYNQLVAKAQAEGLLPVV